MAREILAVFGLLQRLVEIGQPLSILPERFSIQRGTGIADSNHLFALCRDQR